MPRTCALNPRFDRLIAAQDFVVHRRQAIEAGMTPHAVTYRLATQWQVLLPSVYLTHPGEPSRRQRLVAALLYAGPRSAIDGIDACHFYGIRAIRPDDDRVHVVVPDPSHLRSTQWLVVRRTCQAFTTRTTALLRYVDPATAVLAATRGLTSPRTVVALLSEAVQRGIVSTEDLVRTRDGRVGGHAALVKAALEQVGAGVRSSAEGDFRALAEADPGIPPLLYNALLRLPCGTRIRPDALTPDAALIHETNGAVAHRRQDLFEDMQRRHDVLTAAGFTVLHNTPARIRRNGPAVVAEFERCYRRLAQIGWPDGVVLLDRGK